MKQRRTPFVFWSQFFVTDSCTFCVCLEMLEMAEKAEFNVEEQMKYERETGEREED